MNTINCRIKLNEYQDVAGRNITPTEALLLRAMHDPAVHKMAIASGPNDGGNYWKFLSNPTPAGVAMSNGRERTNAEEVQRLRAKYPVRAKSGAHGSHLLDDLFPGMNPQLPQSFKEIGLEVEQPKEQPLKETANQRSSALMPETATAGSAEGEKETEETEPTPPSRPNLRRPRAQNPETQG